MAGGRVARLTGRVPRRRGLLVVGFVMALAMLAASPLAPGKAVTGEPAGASNAQVRILENGAPLGGGTLVDRNWILTARHLFDRPDNPAVYSVRFGVVNDQNDQNDTTNLRSVSRIVPAERGDLALVRLASPVPEGT